MVGRPQITVCDDDNPNRMAECDLVDLLFHGTRVRIDKDGQQFAHWTPLAGRGLEVKTSRMRAAIAECWREAFSDGAPLANRRKRGAMPLVQLIVLAIIQGITEFLPVSSSAHLILAPIIVNGWADQGPLIDVAGHIGSLAAVLLFFRSETAMLFRGGLDTLQFRATDDRRLFLMIAAATIPVLAFAAVLVALNLVDALRSPIVIGWTSIIFGIILWLSDRSPVDKHGLKRVTWREALSIGAAQMLSIIPGTSRSGITMTAARYLGWARPEAARFSMLLAIPTIAAFGVFASIDLIKEGAQATISAAAIVAALSFVTAYLTIAAFMRLTQRVSFTPFVIYRVLLGVALLAFAGKLAG